MASNNLTTSSTSSRWAMSSSIRRSRSIGWSTAPRTRLPSVLRQLRPGCLQRRASTGRRALSVARVRAGEVQLGWREWGKGDVTVVFVHGNLASKDWIELAAPLFPSGIRVIGIDWRGCGESDRPRGEKDGWIAPADLMTMAAAMPNCRLVTVPGIGHSINLELPALYAGYFGGWFGGLTGSGRGLECTGPGLTCPKGPIRPTGAGRAARSVAGSGRGSRGHPWCEDVTAPGKQFRG